MDSSDLERKPHIEISWEIKYIEKLIERLKAENSEVCYSVIRELRKFKADIIIEPLINALKDKKSRPFAIQGLRDTGDKRVVKPLINALEGEDSFIRKVTADALGKIGDKRAVEPLIETLKKITYKRESPGIFFSKIHLIEALREIGDERAGDAVIKFLNNRDPYMRTTAARTLEKIGDKKAVEPLINALKNIQERLMEHEYQELRNSRESIVISTLAKWPKSSYKESVQ